MSRRSGVTLAELLVVLFLLGALSLLAIQSSSSRPEAQALAGELAAQLRAARQRAMTRQQKTGVLLPGSLALSISLLEGASQARLRRTIDWASQYPRARLQAEPVPLAGAEAAWLDASWRSLPALVFDEYGRAHGLPRFEVAGPSGTWTVTVTPEGTVAAQPAHVAYPTGSVARPLVAQSGQNRAPVVDEVLVSPQVSSQMLTGQLEAIVPHGGHLTLTVHAHDPDGDQLYSAWECESGEGFFSSPGEEPLRYDGQRWVGVCQFKPAESMAARSQIRLRCRVRDQAGLASAGGAAASRLTVAVGMPGKLAFWGMAPGTAIPNPGLWISSPEGHSVRQVLPRVTEYATVSWDGTKAVFGSHDDGVWVCNLDGGDRTRMLPAPFGYACYSPNGKYLAAYHLVESANPTLALPQRLRKAANSMPWYPDRIRILSSTGLLRQDIAVPYDPLGVEPIVTLPQLLWSAQSDRLYLLWGKRVGAGLAEPKLRTIPVRDPGLFTDMDWPLDLGLQLHGSPTPMEVRSNDDRVLKGVRSERDPPVVQVREWEGGGRACRPAGSSPYDGKSVILSGFTKDDEVLDFIFALWRKGDQGAARLLLPGVVPFNDVITWIE